MRGGKWTRLPKNGTVDLQWNKACLAAGVQDAQLRDLRALSATWAKKQGKDATALLMHSSAAQTARYCVTGRNPS